MGKGTIAGGGTDGLYQVTLDYGQAARDARVAKITADLAALVAKIAEAQALLDAQQAIDDAQKIVVEAAIATYITVTNAVGPALEAVTAAQDALAALQADGFATPEDIAAAQATLTAANDAYTGAKSAVEPALKNYTEAASELAKIKGETTALRIPLELLKSEQTQQTKDLATWTALVLTETIPAWCADLTEDASGMVATVEIPGENALVLIAPAAPAPGPADGLLTAREVQSPEQVFWNAAVLPGWQKWKPTYRRGTITAIDYENDTANVTLFNDVSSAQNLPINQTANLTAVPVEYMQCDAEAFDVGDVCVVKFTGMDWGNPKVIGFCSNPKSCMPANIYLPVFIEYGAQTLIGTRPFIFVTIFDGFGNELAYRYSSAATIRTNTATLKTGTPSATVTSITGYTITGGNQDIQAWTTNFQRQLDYVPPGDIGTAYSVSIVNSMLNISVNYSPPVSIETLPTGTVYGTPFTGGIYRGTAPASSYSSTPLHEYVASAGLSVVNLIFNGKTYAYGIASSVGSTLVYAYIGLVPD